MSGIVRILSLDTGALLCTVDTILQHETNRHTTNDYSNTTDYAGQNSHDITNDITNDIPNPTSKNSRKYEISSLTFSNDGHYLVISRRDGWVGVLNAWDAYTSGCIIFVGNGGDTTEKDVGKNIETKGGEEDEGVFESDVFESDGDFVDDCGPTPADIFALTRPQGYVVIF